MEEPQKITVGECYLEYSDEVLSGDLHLYKHQQEAVRVDGDVIILDAPTGAGKTLAALKRVIDKKSSAIFIYPTNSLVRNQVDSMQNLLENRLQLKVNLIGEESDTTEAIEKIKTTDIDLLHMTGDSLTSIADRESRAKGSVLDKLLTGTYIPGRIRILLTNPDTLYLAFISKYHRAGRISEQLSTFSTLVLDEFHLYSGPILARLFFMINLYRGNPESPSVNLIFLSATHGDTLDLLKGSFQNSTIIRADPLPNKPKLGRMIRHSSVCSIRAIGSVLSDDKEAQRISDEILEFYDIDLNEDVEVKVLGIFSSVSFAIRVAKKIREKILGRGLNPDSVLYQLHGLVPKSIRTRLKHMKNAILIGTSAIEVGIDFDVPFLVMEAHDVGSFLQRFGRGGRHRKCEAILYIPRVLADALVENDSLPFPDFVNLVHDGLFELPSYAGFLCSKQVSNILYAMALAASRKPRSPYDKTEKYDYDAAVSFFYEMLESNANVSLGDTAIKDVVYEEDKKRVGSRLRNFTIKTMVKHGFLRGTMNSVIVRFPGQLVGTDTAVYGESDIFDIFKMEGHMEDITNHWDRISKRIRERYSKESKIFIAEDLGHPSYPKVVLTDDALARQFTSVYKEPFCHLKFDDVHLSTLGQDLLNKRNLAFHWQSMNWQTDYRIPRLYVEGEPGALVIGDWSFVAEYLLQKQVEGRGKS